MKLMNLAPFSVLSVLLIFLFTGVLHGNEADAEKAKVNPYNKWKNGPSREAGFFPIAVWLQNPSKAKKYLNAGFNTYVGLWKGPTEEQLTELKKAGMKVICNQNAVGLRHVDDPVIVGWMHGDEPDNAQSLGKGKGYGPPIAPKKIVEDYTIIKHRDPSRPVILNLGQGVAWDQWYGRGVRTNHPEDYPEYLKGCDIVSFDIYPVVHSKPEVSGKLWFVAEGVKRLRKWSQDKKVVWNCIECTHINNPTIKPTPSQVRSEVWLSIIHGSMGLIYFVHEWKPKFNESALLSDSDMLSAVTAINMQIKSLAPVLNSLTIDNEATVSSKNDSAQIALMMKKYKGAIYLFAVGTTDVKTTAKFTIKGAGRKKTIEVLGENRTLSLKSRVFKDQFEPYDVHLYRVK